MKKVDNFLYLWYCVDMGIVSEKIEKTALGVAHAAEVFDANPGSVGALIAPLVIFFGLGFWFMPSQVFFALTLFLVSIFLIALVYFSLVVIFGKGQVWIEKQPK